MGDQEQPAFTFVSEAKSEDTFSVVRFHGDEGISRLYRFQIDLVSREKSLDLEGLLEAQATFTIKRQSGDLPFHGILESLEQMQKVGEYTFYRAVLRPKLWWLTLTHHNQVFLDKSLPQFLAQVLKDGGLAQGIDFELKLTKEYPEWEYICQYGESHFSFICHWLERYGSYFYFDQTQGTDKVIIADSRMSHGPMPQGKTFTYYQPSGLEAPHREEVIHSFICSQRPVPAAVLLKDYNSQRPDLSLEARAEISQRGRGELYLYGEHFRTLSEGRDLAQIRAEEQLCRQKLLFGESTVPIIRPGYTFTLDRHYRDDMNTDYLNIEVSHEGNQEAYLRSGLGLSLKSSAESVAYRNSFTAIPSGVQFRPERVTEKSRFHGSMNAKIDAAGSGKYAELDDQGRYKVILPFDRSGRDSGKASCWIRMMQPYAGENHGMHFPLHKGAEVLLTFIDGDPDRPVIAGAMPNPESPSPVTSANQTQAAIATGGKNQLHMEDTEGSEQMSMHCNSPAQHSYIRLGAGMPPGGIPPEAAEAAAEGAKEAYDWGKEKYEQASSKDGLKLFSIKDMDIRVRNKSESLLGMWSTTVEGMKSTTVYGMNSLKVLGSCSQYVAGFKTQANVGSVSQYYGWRSALIPGYTLFAGAKEKVSESETTMAAEVQDMSGNQTNLQGVIEEMQG